MPRIREQKEVRAVYPILIGASIAIMDDEPKVDSMDDYLTVFYMYFSHMQEKIVKTDFQYCKINYSRSGREFIRYNGERFYLDEFVRTDFLAS